MKVRQVLVAALLSVAFPGCVTQAAAPVVPRNADQAVREQSFEQWKLTYEPGFFAPSWKRADGEYPWGALQDVAKTYPQSDEVYQRAQTRATVLGTIGGVGGGLVGFTLGYNLTAQDDKKFSSGTQVALYSTGGGLILLSLIIGAVWHNPAADFADVYNQSLRRDLGLSAGTRGSNAGSTGLSVLPRVKGDSLVWSF